MTSRGQLEGRVRKSQTIRGQGVLVSETVGQEKLISEVEGQGRVVDIREGEARVK